MPNNWKTYKLEELTTKLGDGLHGTPKYSEFGEYYFINGNNLTNGKIEIKKDTKKVIYEEFLKHKKDLNENTLFVSINGTIGNVGTYNGEKVILGKSACYFNIKEGVDKEFIKQIFSSKLSRDYLENNATGTTIKNVSLKTMRDFPINLPPLEEQKSIAAILSAIDDKIENNLAINKTLEEMAMALYKHWFVDFGPFQDGEFVESELGRIPKGWEYGKLEDLVEIKYGKDHKKLNNGKIPVYGSGGIMRYVDEALYEKESILIPRKGTLSNLFYVSTPFWSVDTMFYTKIKNLYFGKYIFYFLKSIDLASMDVGSAVPSLTTELLKRIEILIPSDTIVKQFDDIMNSYFITIEANIKENQTLTQLRDTLLPKLISGEVRLKEFRE